MKSFQLLMLSFVLFFTTACSLNNQAKLENNSWLYVLDLNQEPLEYEVVFDEGLASFTVNQSQLINHHYPDNLQEFEKINNYLNSQLASFDFNSPYEVDNDHLYLTAEKDSNRQQTFKMLFTEDTLQLIPLTKDGQEDTTAEPLILIMVEEVMESSLSNSQLESNERNN